MRWYALLDALLALALVAVVLVTLPRLGASHWVLDNASSLTPQLLAGLALLAALCLARRRTRSGAAALSGAFVLAAQLAPSCGGEGAPVGATISWLVANVRMSNRHHAALATLVAERRPEVVGLLETDQRWVDALDGPLRDYRHRILRPRGDNFGLAFYSRLPLAATTSRDRGYSLGATIDVDGVPVELVLVHVMPPVSARHARARDAQLRALGRLRAPTGARLVVAGDFNITPYSPVFRRVFTDAGFRRAGSLAGSFPAALPWPLRIPIDHALAAGPVAVDAGLERNIESDHLPLWIGIGPRAR